MLRSLLLGLCYGRMKNSYSSETRAPSGFAALSRRSGRDGKARLSVIILGYLGRQYLVVLFFCLLGFSSLFLIIEALDWLPGFFDAEAGGWQIAGYFFHRQILHLVHVLPMSLLLAVSYVLNNLSRNHEITAVRASGISLFQFCLPIWFVALVASGVLFWLNESLIPHHNEKSEQLRHQILTGESERPEWHQARLAFRNHRENRHWFFENFSRTGEQEGVSIKQYRADNQALEWELRARKALWSDGQWRFADGYFFEYEPESSLPARERKFEGEQMAGQLVGRLDETPRGIATRLSPVEKMNLREIIAFLRWEQGAAVSTRRIFQTLAWHRLLLPFSCIMASLLGVGMSTGHGRAGALRGFATAIALMGMYFMISQATLVLGKHQLLPPIVAGALPTVGFTAYGWWLVHRRR